MDYAGIQVPLTPAFSAYLRRIGLTFSRQHILVWQGAAATSDTMLCCDAFLPGQTQLIGLYQFIIHVRQPYSLGVAGMKRCR